jgi:AraC family transcriptional activator of pobA
MSVLQKAKIMQTTSLQPISPIQKSYFFDISPLDSTNPSRGAWAKPVQLPHFQIVWVSRGSGFFNIDLEKYRIEHESAYTIPVGRFHQIFPADQVSGYVLSFNLDFLCLAIEGPGQPLFKEIGSELKAVSMYSVRRGDRALQNILGEIQTEFKANSLSRLQILCGLFKVFLVYVKSQSTSIRQQEVRSCRTRLYNKFYAKLDDQFRTKKQVSDYANELFVSPNYLTHVVKKVTGHSASYHIQQRTVQEAKRLIMYDEVTMKMVASSLGFEDLSHFSKYFNFTDFRKRIC